MISAAKVNCFIALLSGFPISSLAHIRSLITIIIFYYYVVKCLRYLIHHSLSLFGFVHDNLKQLAC